MLYTIIIILTLHPTLIRELCSYGEKSDWSKLGDFYFAVFASFENICTTFTTTLEVFDNLQLTGIVEEKLVPNSTLVNTLHTEYIH